MRSIRRYLIIVLLSVVCLVNFIAALEGYQASMANAEQLLDKQLADNHLTIEQLKSTNQKLPENLFGDQRLFQIWHGETLIQASGNAPQNQLIQGGKNYFNYNYMGHRWRVHRHQNGDSTIVVAQRYQMYSRLIEEMIIESILPIIWVLPFLAVLIWFIVQQGLKPLTHLARSLNRRSSSDLDPVNQQGYPRELETVTQSINQLMSRLNHAFEREKRFSADAAHELRTPLSALKINLHNLRRELPENNQHLNQLSDSVERMGHSIEQILALHRLSEEKLLDSRRPCDLTSIAQQSIVDLYDVAQQRQQVLSLEGDHSTPLMADQFALQTLLRNLLDNACKYSPPGSSITVHCANQEQQVILHVDDSGPGISHAERHRAMDRFYRIGGDSHNSSVVGSGLGLSIVEQIVKLHGGEISLGQSEKLGGLSVIITLPKNTGGTLQ